MRPNNYYNPVAILRSELVLVLELLANLVLLVWLVESIMYLNNSKLWKNKKQLSMVQKMFDCRVYSRAKETYSAKGLKCFLNTMADPK